MRVTLLFAALFFASARFTCAQTAVSISDTAKQHIFRHNEISFFEDERSCLTIGQIIVPEFQKKFHSNTAPTPVTKNPASAFWYRVIIKYDPGSKNNWILEFFDQTIDSITVYAPAKNNTYTATLLGSSRPFTARLYQHKNLSLNINNALAGTGTFYIRIKSHRSVNVIMVLRSVRWFIGYALEEYFLFGIFYGMVLVFGLYNLIMFIAIRQKQYLYYIVYNISIGLYEMCADGIAYQYIWPLSPEWNHYAYGIALFLASIFAILFAQSLLSLKVRAPRLNKILLGIIALRSIFFVICLFNKNLFSYKIIEIIPLVVAYMAGCYVLIRGYGPARFFVVGYMFLLFGFIIKALIAFDLWWQPVTAFNYYTLSFCFIMEMFFVSFAIGDRVRLLRIQKKNAQQRIIKELRQKEQLKDIINKKLEEQVDERTSQLMQKSVIIEQQNKELTEVNKLLHQQAEEISRMNILLERDNFVLQNNIEEVTHNRVMSADVDFEEFSKTYPDRETCFKFLSNLKWGKGYSCRKCGGTYYGSGHLPYSRRCSKCGYEESVIAYTILQNTRIPINKAFYMIFLVYSTKGKISSHKLSEILSIRQSTCWAYSSRIKKV
ncbi:MAG TPA: 7TM diverse intracellular signaling domain-containing protein, partial [Mucilaginibacter sp.]|nr:7TM diverse intracellular signaling domain-containing protein [Mucilaginibacter sp.]